MSTSTESTSQKITKPAVDRLDLPAARQVHLRYAELKNFAVRVTSIVVKSFILEKRVDCKVKRVTLGRCGCQRNGSRDPAHNKAKIRLTFNA